MTEHQSAAGSGGDRLRQTAEDARSKVAERAAEVKQDAKDAARQAKADAAAKAERFKSSGAGRVRDISNALDQAAEDLGHDSPSGSLIREAADGLDQIASSIESRSVAEMVNAVADFGRRNPTVFLGGAMLAGFALSRFATASAPSDRYGTPHEFDRHFEYDRPAGPPAGSVSRDPGTGARHAAGPAPAAESSRDLSGDHAEQPLKLRPSMRPGGDQPSTSGTSSHRGEGGPVTSPGTASAATDLDDPYPSAGPIPAATKEDRT